MRVYRCWNEGDTSEDDDWRYEVESPEVAALAFGNECAEHEPAYTFTEPMDVKVRDLTTGLVKVVRIGFSFKAVAFVDAPHNQPAQEPPP